jgi:hypothetical protein
MTIAGDSTPRSGAQGGYGRRHARPVVVALFGKTLHRNLGYLAKSRGCQLRHCDANYAKRLKSSVPVEVGPVIFGASGARIPLRLIAPFTLAGGRR